jgi:hypothetical protein
MEKDMVDLANKNDVLQARMPESSYSMTTPLADEEAHNSHTGGRHKEDGSLTQN